MIQEPPPKLSDHWPKDWRKDLEAVMDWCIRHHPFPGDDSITMEEKPGGLSVKAQLVPAETLRPLQLVPAPTEANPERVRVVIGGIQWGGIFWYADADMNANEDGTTGKEYFYVTGLSDGDSIWVKTTLSFDGVFWRADGLSIESGSSVPDPDATTSTLLLGTVNITGDLLTITEPQTLIGNFGGRRFGVVSGFQDEYWPLVAAISL